MAKIIDIDYRNGSTLEKINSSLPTLVNTPKIVKTPKGQAFDFVKASSQAVYYPTTSGIVTTNDFCIEIWGKIKPGNTGTTWFLRKGGAGVVGYSVYLSQTTGLISLDLQDAGGGTSMQSVSTGFNYFHLICNFDRDGNSTLYMNNVLERTTAISTRSGTLSSALNFILGASSTSGVDPLDGQILKCVVHDRLLTEQERNTSYADFLASKPISKPKRGFITNKPTDLSTQVNNTLGNNITTNGTFTTWSGVFPNELPDGWVQSAGTADATTYFTQVGNAVRMVSDGDLIQLQQSSILTTGIRYRLLFNVTNYVSGTIQVQLGSASTTLNISSAGQKVFEGVSTGSHLIIKRLTACDITFDDCFVYPITGLVAAYNMKPNGLTLTDISGNGNNGTVSGGVVNTKDGMLFNGVDGIITAGSALSTQLEYTDTQSLSLKFNTSTDVTTEQSLVGNYVGDSNRWGVQIKSGSVFLTYYNGSGTSKSSAISAGTNNTLTWTWTGSALTAYLNGVAITGTDGVNHQPISGNFMLGKYSTAYPFKGEMQDARIYNRILSLQEAKDYHNSFAKQPYLVEDFSDLPADGTSIVPRDWTKISGSFKGGEISIASGELVTDPSIETATWTGYNSPLTSERSSEQARTGTYSWKVVTNGANQGASNNSPSLIAYTVGKRYRITAFIYPTTSINITVLPRNGGSSMGSGQTFSSLTPNTWNRLSFEFANSITTTTTGNVAIYSNATGQTFYIDDISVTEIPPLPTLTKGSKYLECVTAGIIAIPSNQLAGTWEWDWYKGADANTSKFNFVAPNFAGDGLSSMTFYVDNSENLLLRVSNSTIASTATSYFQNFTWYRVRVTRTTAGSWTMLIKGGAFTPTAGYDGWTLISTTGGTGTNPIINTVISSSIYLLFDIDAGDRFTNLKLTNGVII